MNAIQVTSGEWTKTPFWLRLLRYGRRRRWIEVKFLDSLGYLVCGDQSHWQYNDGRKLDDRL